MDTLAITPQEKLNQLVNGDVTYGGAFQVDKRTKGTGKAIGAVSYVCSKLNLPCDENTTIASLRKNYDKEAVNAALVELKQAKNLRGVHSRQVWSLIGSDSNYALVVKGTANKKGEFTGFTGRAKFMTPAKAKKQSKDATIAELRARLAAAGITA